MSVNVQSAVGFGVTNFSVLMIDHNVMRLDITVHDSLAVAEIEGLEELEDVESDINIVELGVQASEISVVDMLKDERRCLALGMAAISWSPES